MGETLAGDVAVAAAADTAVEAEAVLSLTASTSLTLRRTSARTTLTEWDTTVAPMFSHVGMSAMIARGEAEAVEAATRGADAREAQVRLGS